MPVGKPLPVTTVIEAEAVREPETAVRVAVPSAAPETRPVELTVAMVASEEDQKTESVRFSVLLPLRVAVFFAAPPIVPELLPGRLIPVPLIPCRFTIFVGTAGLTTGRFG